MDEPEEYVDFMAKYRDWVAFKRLGIRDGTTPQEVAFHISGIKYTIDSKICKLLDIDTASIDSYAESITSGKKRSYEDLAKAIGALSGPKTREVLSGAVKRKENVPLAETYLLNKVIVDLGFDTFPNQLLMSKSYAELKLPKELKMAMAREKRKKEKEAGEVK
ncbi:MAG: DUF2666 domain-containing protein [Candidatus Marsarchaeota archaeon]|nr:DUF2666 domain-containing protein [Candidatus Marsarchaeota archaeon]